MKQSFSDDLLARIETFALRAARAYAASRKVVFFGNGGSAADAQHLAAELVVRLHADRPGLAALASPPRDSPRPDTRSSPDWRPELTLPHTAARWIGESGRSR